MRVVVTGGGSGGHIYPALAVADALRRQSGDTQVAYVGGTAGMEAQIVPATGVPFTGVTTRKLTKILSPNTVLAALALLKGYREARAFLKQWKPHAVVGTGGYVAAATILAAARQSVPTVILSPDAVAGRTNRWLSRWARRICLWLGPDDEFPAGRITRTGLPIRREVVGVDDRGDARASIGLDDRFTLLVMGGSQGAQRLNELTIEAASLLPEGIQIYHQTGERNFHDAVRLAEERGVAERIGIRAYISAEELPRVYRSADLLLCRCGVGMLAEGTANGLPLLMVPLPTAYADHQTMNARAIERSGGGITLAQADLDGERLAEQILALRGDGARLAAMAAASRTQGRVDAADAIAEIVSELV